jgi:hypothetical protein
LITLNAIGTGNYGYQYVDATDTTVSAARSAANHLYPGGGSIAASNYGQANLFLFAKSGFIRPTLSNYVYGISGTTVTNTGAFGDVCTNTADNITSLTILDAFGVGYAVGSQFDLYALRPNG